MTNLGFRLAMAEHGIEVVETQVGDRYVLEALDKRGLALGGEQSGHVIFRRLATTGDGLLTGLQLLDLVARADRPLSELAAAAMTRLPQVLVGVRVARRDPRLLDALAADVAAVEAELGERGRVLVRASGTEPLVRVMVEAPDEAVARASADRLADAVARRASELRLTEPGPASVPGEAGASGVLVDRDDLAAGSPRVGVGDGGHSAEGDGRGGVAGWRPTRPPGANGPGRNEAVTTKSKVPRSLGSAVL